MVDQEKVVMIFHFIKAERLKDSLYVIMIDQRGVCRSEEITEDEALD